MKKIISCVFTLILCFFFFACRKESSQNLHSFTPVENERIRSAKQWLDTSVTGREIKNLTFRSNSVALTALPDWDKSRLTYSGKYSYVEVPLLTLDKLLPDGMLERRVSIMFQFSPGAAIETRIKQTYHNQDTKVSDGSSWGATTIVVFDGLDFRTKAAFLYSSNTKQFTRIYRANSTNTASIKKSDIGDVIRKNNVPVCTMYSVPVYDYQCNGNQNGTDYNVSCGYVNTGYTNFTACSDGPSDSDPFFYFGGGGSGGGGASGGGGGEEEPPIDLEHNPPCPNSFRFIPSSSNSFTAEVWGITYTLYTDPNYPSYGKIGEVTFGMEINIQTDIIYNAASVKANIIAYVGAADLLLDPDFGDLRLKTDLNGQQHLLISPRAMSMITTHAFYEASEALKGAGEIVQFLSLPGGKGALKTAFKNHLLDALGPLGIGGRTTILNVESPNSWPLQYAVFNPLTGKYYCP